MLLQTKIISTHLHARPLAGAEKIPAIQRNYFAYVSRAHQLVIMMSRAARRICVSFSERVNIQKRLL